jgi:hypothetical protein
MGRRTKALTNTEVNKAKPRDKGAVWLAIKPVTETRISISGAYPEVSLKTARDRRKEAENYSLKI